MKTYKEIRKAAREHSNNVNLDADETVREYAIKDFIAGAEWMQAEQKLLHSPPVSLGERADKKEQALIGLINRVEDRNLSNRLMSAFGDYKRALSTLSSSTAEQGEEKIICKYCGVECDPQSEEGCYRNPNHVSLEQSHGNIPPPPTHVEAAGKEGEQRIVCKYCGIDCLPGTEENCYRNPDRVEPSPSCGKE